MNAGTAPSERDRQDPGPPQADQPLQAAGVLVCAVASGLATDFEGAYAVEDRLSREILAGPAAVEGARAFAEKRPPAWRLS